MSRRYGYTVPELLLVLTLLGVLLAAAAPPIIRWRDTFAVAAARDEIAGALASTRLLAVAAGGAHLAIDPASSTVWISTPHRDSLQLVPFGERHGVGIDTGGSEVAEIRYDAFGIGRMASRTVQVKRGNATARLTIGSYGRVRLW